MTFRVLLHDIDERPTANANTWNLLIFSWHIRLEG